MACSPVDTFNKVNDDFQGSSTKLNDEFIIDHQVALSIRTIEEPANHTVVVSKLEK